MLKDERLAAVAREANVAAFASFDPDGAPRRAVGVAGADLGSLVAALLARGGSVNVRSFRPAAGEGGPFRYGLTSVDAAVAAVRELSAAGWHTIVNETVDVADGGVSGVLLGGAAEFAPGLTPRAVEGADAAALPADLAIALLSAVYGPVHLADVPGRRVEFSVHPGPVGVRGTNTLVWEVADVAPVRLPATPAWPDAMSRHLGDKAYGLLVAHVAGLPVPRTTVVGRRVAPFTFGRPIGRGRWTRTCPVEPRPGLFTTARGWLDPYALLAREDPDGTAIASVLDQDGVPAAWSGATAVGADGSVLVEGVAGTGDGFMLGAAPAAVPAGVVADVRALVERAATRLGPARVEWAHDGERAWVLQLHRARVRLPAGVLNPGEADRWLPYDPADGLDRLRDLVASVPAGAGVEVTGPVGVTSHVGDVLRKAGVPGRLRPARERPSAPPGGRNP